MKTCTKCGVKKPLTEYWKKKTNVDGFCYQCKSCMKKAKHGCAGKERIVWRYVQFAEVKPAECLKRIKSCSPSRVIQAKAAAILWWDHVTNWKPDCNISKIKAIADRLDVYGNPTVDVEDLTAALIVVGYLPGQAAKRAAPEPAKARHVAK